MSTEVSSAVGPLISTGSIHMTTHMLLHWGRIYAALGYPVMPLHNINDDLTCTCGTDCGPNVGQHPRRENGHALATTDLNEIERWWTRWPTANMGIRTGDTSGLLALLVHPGEGRKSLEELYAQLGGLDCLSVLAGGGRKYLVFGHPAGAEVPSRWNLLPGIALMSRDGFIVVPPSVHLSGAVYAWASGSRIDQLQPPPVPPVVLEAALARSLVTTPVIGRPSGSSPANINGAPTSATQAPVQKPDMRKIATVVPPVAREHDAGAEGLDGVARETDEAGFHELKPLRTSNLSTFPVQVFPEWLRAQVMAVALMTQTPADLPAMLALGTLSTALVRRFRVSPRPGWTEELVFSSVTALGSGNRKSAVFEAMFRPLHVWEETLLSDPDAPRQLFVDDATSAGLVEVLATHGVAAIASAEGGWVHNLKRRFGQVPILDLYLKGYTGEAVTINRKGKRYRIPRPCLPINSTVQPEILRDLLGSHRLRGVGVLPRFCFSIPESKVGNRQTNPRPVSDEGSGAYLENVLSLTSLPERVDPIPFDAAANQIMAAFEGWKEQQLRTGGSLFLLQDWGSKLPGTVARMAALLHLADQAGQPNAGATPVPRDAVERAVLIARTYLIEHALAAFQTMGFDEESDNAEILLDWIIRMHRQKKQLRFTRREAHRGCHNRKTATQLKVALDRLIEHGHIRPDLHVWQTRVDGVARPPGYGVPSDPYIVNPKLLADDVDVRLTDPTYSGIDVEPANTVGEDVAAVSPDNGDKGATNSSVTIVTQTDPAEDVANVGSPTGEAQTATSVDSAASSNGL